MTEPARLLLQQAMGLTSTERLGLATRLIASVGEPADTDWDGAWRAEVARRVDAIAAVANRPRIGATSAPVSGSGSASFESSEANSASSPIARSGASRSCTTRSAANSLALRREGAPALRTAAR